MKGRPSCFLFEIISLFTFLLLPFYFLPFPLRYFTLHRISISDAIRNSLSVSAGAAGRSLWWILSVIHACDLFRGFGPYGDDQVVVMLVFILLLTFPFVSCSCYRLLSLSVALFRITNSSTCVPCLLQTMHFYAISVVGCHLELYNLCLYAQQVTVCGGFLFMIPGMPCGTQLYVRVRFG